MIYFKIKDNFGNWLFRYAAALSTGLPVCGVLCDKSRLRALSHFGAFFKDLKTVDRVPEGVRTYEQPRFAYDPFPAELRTGDWLINGHFQSWRFIDEAIVRKVLVPPQEKISALQEQYGDWLRRPNVTSVSVRRGDYLKYPEYHPFVGKRFYRDAFARLSEAKDFIVCSDDIPWCREFFPKAFPDRNFRFAGDSWHDLLLPALCQHNVISNSTFSWWGAWLNTKTARRILAPSHWFGLGYRKLSVADLYLPGTEIVPNSQDLLPFLHGVGNLLTRKLKVKFCK